MVKLDFTQNHYNLCMANKQINDSTFTIVWNIENMKISHKGDKIARQIFNQLEGEYGKMRVITGKSILTVG